VKPIDGKANAKKRASACAELIRNDARVREIWREITARVDFTAADGSPLHEGDIYDECSAFYYLAVGISDLHFALPIESAKLRFERRRRMQRAIEAFRNAIDTYQRQSGDWLPSLNHVLYAETPASLREDVNWRRLPTIEAEHCLAYLDEHLHDGAGGTSIHPMLATKTGRVSSTPDSIAIVWIVRTLDNVGVPRSTTQDKDAFLRLAVRLSEVFIESRPPCDISPSRNDFQNHPEFKGLGTMQWRDRPEDGSN
jgi:type II secretory pathway pseudopilin PulG